MHAVHVIYLCESAFRQLQEEVHRWSRKETGGILLGYETRNAIVLTSATGPGPNAKHSRNTIELDLDYISAHAAAANEHGLQYQGSWHSHPRTTITGPSATDIALLHRTANSTNYRLTTAVQLMTTIHPERITDIIALTCDRGTKQTRAARVILCSDP